MQKERPNRYLQISTVGSRSGGSDLAGMRSNLGHCLQIGRPRMKGARSGGAGSPEMASRGGAALRTRRTSAFQRFRAQIDQVLGLGWTTRHA